MRIRVQETWGPKHALVAVSFELKIAEPKLDDWVSQTRRSFFLEEVWSESDVATMPRHLYCALDPDPNVNSLSA